MSTSGTIGNLQQALNCAGKCDCCDKLQQQINALQNSNASLQRQIGSLQSQLGDLANKVNNPPKSPSRPQSPLDLSPIYTRLDKIEGYITKLDAAGTQIKNLIPTIQKELNDFIKLIVEGFLGGLFK